MTTPTPNNQNDELEMQLMKLFTACELFGQTFMTSATKEEFADAIKYGALDHQEAAHKAMQLIFSWHNQQLEQLKAHLVYMAGEYEGITGRKSEYLLKNWAEYAQLSKVQILQLPPGYNPNDWEPTADGRGWQRKSQLSKSKRV